MKLAFAFAGLFALAVPLLAEEAPTKKEPGAKNKPLIIELKPSGAPVVSSGIIQTELSGRSLLFFKEASRTGREQLALAEAAKTKSTSEQVKAVAETIAKTGSTESQEIARLAQARHVPLDETGPGSAALQALAASSGVKFDKAWVEQLMATCEASVVAYESALKSDDAELRTFAEKMLPVAKARLQIANRLGGRPVAIPAAATPAPPAR